MSQDTLPVGIAVSSRLLYFREDTAIPTGNVLFRQTVKWVRD